MTRLEDCCFRCCNTVACVDNNGCTNCGRVCGCTPNDVTTEHGTSPTFDGRVTVTGYCRHDQPITHVTDRVI